MTATSKVYTFRPIHIIYFSVPWALMGFAKAFSLKAAVTMHPLPFAGFLGLGCLTGVIAYMSFFRKDFNLEIKIPEIYVGLLGALSIFTLFTAPRVVPQDGLIYQVYMLSLMLLGVVVLLAFKGKNWLFKSIFLTAMLPFGSIVLLKDLPFADFHKLNAGPLLFSAFIFITLALKNLEIKRVLLNMSGFLIIMSFFGLSQISFTKEMIPVQTNLALSGVLLTWGICILVELSGFLEIVQAFLSLPLVSMTYVTTLGHIQRNGWFVIVPILLLSYGALTIVASFQEEHKKLAKN